MTSRPPLHVNILRADQQLLNQRSNHFSWVLLSGTDPWMHPQHWGQIHRDNGTEPRPEHERCISIITAGRGELQLQMKSPLWHTASRWRSLHFTFAAGYWLRAAFTGLGHQTSFSTSEVSSVLWSHIVSSFWDVLMRLNHERLGGQSFVKTSVLTKVSGFNEEKLQGAL